MKYLYACAIGAKRIDGCITKYVQYPATVVLEVRSFDMARGRALRLVEEKLPMSEGYSEHWAAVMEVSQETLDWLKE